MGAAAAEVAGKSCPDVALARPRIAVDELLGRHDHAVAAVAALRRLLLDEGALQRVRLVDRAEPLERRDLARRDGADRRHAGAYRLAVDQHRAGAALRQAAAILGAVELEIVTQDVEQGRVGLGLDRVAYPVDFEADGHELASPGLPTLAAPLLLLGTVLLCAHEWPASRPLLGGEAETADELALELVVGFCLRLELRAGQLRHGMTGIVDRLTDGLPANPIGSAAFQCGA